MKKTLTLSMTLSALILVVSFLSGCTGSSGTSQGTQPEKIETTANKTEADKKEKQDFKLGETVKLGDYIVSANKLENPYLEKNEFSQPAEGNKLVAVEVAYQNNTDDKTISYNPLDWNLFDGEGYSYEVSFMSSKEPSLNSGDLNPGSKVKGWITFEVQENSKDFKLQFVPNFWDNDNVEIKLY